jgi:hypothetical protein
MLDDDGVIVTAAVAFATVTIEDEPDALLYVAVLLESGV